MRIGHSFSLLAFVLLSFAAKTRLLCPADTHNSSCKRTAECWATFLMMIIQKFCNRMRESMACVMMRITDDSNEQCQQAKNQKLSLCAHAAPISRDLVQVAAGVAPSAWKVTPWECHSLTSQCDLFAGDQC